MVERFLPTSQKEQRRAWGIFRRYPTTDNLIAFKRAKALARRIRRQCQRDLGSSMCLQSHRQLPVNSYGERSKQRMAFIGIFNIPILETSTPQGLTFLGGYGFHADSTAQTFVFLAPLRGAPRHAVRSSGDISEEYHDKCGRGYNCVRRDVDGDTSPTGGVRPLFTSPSGRSRFFT
ncbi:hypothetical protein TNCV_3082411, partial [Trichonephila clavipes]